MILRVQAKNFYSVADEVEVDFCVNKNAPDKHLYKKIKAKGFDERVSLVNSIIGPNASGKTTVVKSIIALKHLISLSAQLELEGSGFRYIAPHKAHVDEHTSLGVKFAVDSRIFEYVFILDRERILSEILYEYSKEAERFTSKKVFSREWDDAAGKYRFVTSDESLKLFETFTRENASVISVASGFPKCKIAQLIAEYWRNAVASNVRVAPLGIPVMNGRNNILDNILDSPFGDYIKDIMTKYDDSYDGVSRRESAVDKLVIYDYEIKHKYRGRSISVPWGDESSGTRRVLEMISSMVKILYGESGGVVVIDELDAYLHPDLSEAIVELFQDEYINKNGSQIIFSTHNHRILTTLDKQEIFLIEKDDRGETDIWRLDEVGGVRSDDNYYAKYMAGAYSAKPRIR